MTIPVNANDDDFFISTTLYDAYTICEDLKHSIVLLKEGKINVDTFIESFS